MRWSKTRGTTDAHRFTPISFCRDHPYYYHPKSAKASQIFPAALGYQCESVFICGSVFLGCGFAAPGKSVCIYGSVSFSIPPSSTAIRRAESKSSGGRTAAIWIGTRGQPGRGFAAGKRKEELEEQRRFGANFEPFGSVPATLFSPKFCV